MKLLHVAGVVLFLGNITIGVFWKNYADATGNTAIMAYAMDGVIRADKIFTIPGIALLLIGGVGAAIVGGYPILYTGWILWALIAFVLSGLAFAPLARTQRGLSLAAHTGNMPDYESLSKRWNLWGFIALAMPVAAFVLMIVKPALPAFHR
ncbi:MAG: DUF2269 family protein [Candidatus Eremiobacteraeota bacterium]|nr:DUF2269 family protein [Candidatus Eremiobacteraeota bacterium]